MATAQPPTSVREASPARGCLHLRFGWCADVEVGVGQPTAIATGRAGVPGSEGPSEAV